MFYVVGERGKKLIVIERFNTTDATYHEVKKEFDRIEGQFGREEYANIWKDFYNGDISRRELHCKLGI